MIKVQNLFFKYPGSDSPILQDISVLIESGCSLSIIGANGSGKSTFARCLNGLHLPTSGSILIENLQVDVEKDNERIRQLVGMVFQNPDNQIVSTSVEREIAFGMENLSVPSDRMVQTVDKLLMEFNLSQYRYRPPHNLSGGEKQLLALAAVLAMEPSYLILDEPTSLLDPYSRKKMLETIFTDSNKRFHQITPILITQYPEETFFTERLIVFNHGKIIYDDSPQQVFKNSQKLIKMGIAVPVENQMDF